MYVDRIIYPISSLGPGKRIVVWTSGCNRRCLGCANPELWNQYPEQEIKPERLAESLKKQFNFQEVDGISITGGEPFDQAEDILELIDNLEFKGDILAFSGYTIEAIKNNDSMKLLLDEVDVLIDGEYIEELNDGKAVLRGSANQRIHILNPVVKGIYDDYLKSGRQIQNFIYDYKTISVGIHNNDSRV